MTGKNKKNLSILLAVAILLLGGLTYWFEIRPAWERIEALRNENSLLTEQVQRGRTLAAGLEEERAQLAAWEGAGDLMKLILPPLNELPLMLDRVEVRLRSEELELEFLQGEKIDYDEENNLFIVPLHFKVSATADDYMNLIKDLEASLNIIHLKAVNYSLDENIFNGIVFIEIFFTP